MTPGMTGTHHGHVAGTVGAAWTQIGSGALNDMQSGANPADVLPSGLYVSSYIIVNTHATQDIYYCEGAVGAGSARPGGRQTLYPLESRTVDCYGLGGGVTTISIAGSAAGTTYDLDVYCTLRRA